MNDNPPAEADDREAIVGERIPAKDVFLAWEKLRVVYVAVLAIVTVAIIGADLARTELWIPLVVNAIAANLCFFAGPIGELYLTWLGVPRTFVRYGLFNAGTILAVSLAWWNLELLGMFLNLPQAG